MSPTLGRVARWSAAAVLIGCVVWAGVWRLQGGRWERVETPSMGTTAPVGTLLWVEPARFADLRVGEFITFHPPGDPDVTFSHRVYVINGDGTISTKGQLSAPDPWHLTSKDIVGRVAMRWWGVGWLVGAAPLLLGGTAVLLLIRSAVAREWRLPVAVTGAALLLCLALLIYRPLVRAEQLSFAPSTGGARASYVSTGLAPLRLHAVGGGLVDLRAGEVGTLVVPPTGTPATYRVTVGPRIPFWWWLVLALFCFLPAIGTLVVGVSEEDTGETHSPEHLAV